ncbi:MAG: zinc ribbon domain-containing protein [Anaerolineales bacterium]|nr:zinc ribbon domain-containing protein [Anaerolineales bacterium]
MTKKSLGYVELEWNCPNCGSKNAGTATVCASCGAPQPEDVKFEQAAQEVMLTDQEKIDRAKSGPDIHCAYCGTRNPASSTVCSQCGADLAEGSQRGDGRTLGTHRDKAAPDILCPACGSPNPATAHRCSQCNTSLATPKPTQAKQQPAPRRKNTWIYIVGGIALFACVIFAFLLLHTEEEAGQVTSVQWTYTIAIEELGPVEYSTWQDEIPTGAVMGSYQDRVRRTQDSPALNSVEVCGTPYTVDSGTGIGEVVQDCQYEIHDDWCSYTVQEWQQVDAVSSSGNDFAPYWPEPQLLTGQREGESSEQYEIFFDSDGRDYTYDTTDYDTFVQCEIGSKWILNVNALNAVVSISPAN